MKRFLLLLLAVPALAFAQGKMPAKSATYDAQIIRVSDGDTVVIAAPFLDQRAQLASKFTTQALQSHPKHQVIIYGWDKFGGRILGDILVNGQSIRQGLISNGLAREYYGEAKQSWCQ